eukprot:scaffold109_cov252-Pinguiococcus_pyrenoidosus.AAC.21
MHLRFEGQFQRLHLLRVEGVIDGVPAESLVHVHFPHGPVQRVHREHFPKGALVAAGRQLLGGLGIEIAESRVEKASFRRSVKSQRRRSV